MQKYSSKEQDWKCTPVNVPRDKSCLLQDSITIAALLGWMLGLLAATEVV